MPFIYGLLLLLFLPSYVSLVLIGAQWGLLPFGLGLGLELGLGLRAAQWGLLQRHLAVLLP